MHLWSNLLEVFYPMPLEGRIASLCVLVLLLIVYVIVGILGSIVGRAAYGFLPPIFATFEALQERKVTNFTTGNSLYVYLINLYPN